MANDALVATAALLSVSASLPFYLYGAWYILEQEIVTWDVLTHHLKFIAVGLVLTTVPVVGWMLPRFPDQLGGLAAVHAFLGVQAYALLVFALTGIVRIFQFKRAHDLYAKPGQEVDIGSLHENMDAWRGRLRLGVAGYVLLWSLAWLLGIVRYVNLHL